MKEEVHKVLHTHYVFTSLIVASILVGEMMVLCPFWYSLTIHRQTLLPKVRKNKLCISIINMISYWKETDTLIKKDPQTLNGYFIEVFFSFNTKK